MYVIARIGGKFRAPSLPCQARRWLVRRSCGAPLLLDLRTPTDGASDERESSDPPTAHDGPTGRTRWSPSSSPYTTGRPTCARASTRCCARPTPTSRSSSSTMPPPTRRRPSWLRTATGSASSVRRRTAASTETRTTASPRHAASSSRSITPTTSTNRRSSSARRTSLPPPGSGRRVLSGHFHRRRRPRVRPPAPAARVPRTLAPAYYTVLNGFSATSNRFLVCPSAMVRATAYRELGPYRDVEYGIGSDLDMWLRIREGHPLGLLIEDT